MVFHRRRMLAPINTEKHFQPIVGTTVAAGAILNTVLIDAVAAPSAAFEIDQGSVIKAIYCELWLNGSGLTDTHSIFNVTVEKLSADVTSMTATQSANLGTYPNKKNILYTTQGILAAGVDGAQSVPILRQWIAIPKGKQRFGLTDRLNINTSNISSNDLIICGIFIYKEYK